MKTPAIVVQKHNELLDQSVNELKKILTQKLPANVEIFFKIEMRVGLKSFYDAIVDDSEKIKPISRLAKTQFIIKLGVNAQRVTISIDFKLNSCYVNVAFSNKLDYGSERNIEEERFQIL